MFYIKVDFENDQFRKEVFGPYRSTDEASRDLTDKGWYDVTSLFGYCPTFVKAEGVNDMKAIIQPLQMLNL